MRTLFTHFALAAMALGFSATMTLAADAQKDLPGPIDSLQDLQDSGKMLFKLADENNDGQISQREAVDAGNLLVGGFFFRADANGDGTVSKQEMTDAENNMLAQRPMLRFLWQRTQSRNPQAATEAKNAAQGALSIIDTNGDGQIQAVELRQGVNTGVQGLFATADTNRDGQLSPTEVNAAMIGAARTVAQAAFRQADGDNNGQISQAEFDKALIAPANALFRVLDANNDGQVSAQEAQAAERILASQVRRLSVPEPANSARHLIQSGRTPEQVAPVPNINLPARPANTATQPR